MRGLLAGRAAPHAGHNPAGGWAKFAQHMAGLGASFHGVPVRRGIDEPDGLDQAVGRANRLILARYVLPSVFVLYTGYRYGWNAETTGLTLTFTGILNIAVEGGHYWPLPYYLRMYPVGYGEFPQAAKAPLRLIPATDASEPIVPGYAVSSLTLREGGDRYWVLVAKGYESVFIGK